jgi:DNA-binding response OmpR family regulator
VADLALDPLTHRVSRGEETIHLTAREYILLELLMRHTGQVLTRDQIAASAWDFSAEHASNVVDVFIGHLRRKIDDPYPLKLLATVRGVGYMLRDPSGANRGAGP